MSKRDIVGYLGISMKTLYNWEKERPNLYKTVMKGLAYDEIVRLNEETCEKARALRERFEKVKWCQPQNIPVEFLSISSSKSSKSWDASKNSYMCHILFLSA